MLLFEWILVLLLAAVILANLAERLAVPYPSLLAIAGAGLAFLPFAPGESLLNDATALLIYAPPSPPPWGHSASSATRRSCCSRLLGAWSQAT